MILSEWLGVIRKLEGYVWVRSACDSCTNTLYLLAEETEIVSTSVKVLLLCLCSFVTTQFERLLGGIYTSYSQGKAEWKSSFSV